MAVLAIWKAGTSFILEGSDPTETADRPVGGAEYGRCHVGSRIRKVHIAETGHGMWYNLIWPTLYRHLTEMKVLLLTFISHAPPSNANSNILDNRQSTNQHLGRQTAGRILPCWLSLLPANSAYVAIRRAKTSLVPLRLLSIEISYYLVWGLPRSSFPETNFVDYDFSSSLWKGLVASERSYSYGHVLRDRRAHD